MEGAKSEEYTVDYFIEKFEKIPETAWTCYVWENAEGSCCALGHCSVRRPEHMGNPEAAALLRIFGDGEEGYPNVLTINDGRHDLYKQDTPKQRILVALKDIKTRLTA